MANFMTRTAHSLSTPVEATAAERSVVRRTCLTGRGGFDRFEVNFTENAGVADERRRGVKRWISTTGFLSNDGNYNT